MTNNNNLYENLKKISISIKCKLEILFTYHKVKKVSRIIINNNIILQKLYDIFDQNDLFYEIQDYKFGHNTIEKGKGNWSNIGTVIPLNDPNGSFLIYISRDQNSCKLAKQIDKSHQDFELGKLLGYPECCINFFIEQFRNQPLKQADLIEPISKNLSIYPFQNNIAIRYLKPALINHFPCSFDCTHSINLANTNLNIIENYNLDLALAIKNWLKSFVLYTEYDGIFISKDYHFEGNIIYYNDIKGTIKNSLYNLLSKNNKIICRDHKNFNIGDKKFKNYGRLILFN